MELVMPPDASKRLLDTSTYELHFDNNDEFQRLPEYAIVSHRWLKEEITFHKLQSTGIPEYGPDSPQLKKVRGACRKAREQGIKWLWLDSICINKMNPAEDSSAIGSMLKWYRDATVCYTYLSDVGAATEQDVSKRLFDREGEPGKPSEWFERGWTLQELLAPERMEFYDKDWTFMGTKAQLAEPLAAITRIDVSYLSGRMDFRKANIAVKMSWMAGRKTSKVEDLAYSMLGIFDVDMKADYSDGPRAFVKMQQKILMRTQDETIFVWKTPEPGLPQTDSPGDWGEDEWGMLAPSPDCFRDSGDVREDAKKYARKQTLQFGQEGLEFPFPGSDYTPAWMKWAFASSILLPILGPLTAMSVMLIRNERKFEFALTLNCLRRHENLWKPVQVYLCRRVGGSLHKNRVFRRHRCSELGLASSDHRRTGDSTEKMIVLNPYPRK